MGNLLSVATDAWINWGNDNEIEDSKGGDDKQLEEVDAILKSESSNMWNLLQFLETQGQDVRDLKKQIAAIWKHHKEMNYHYVTRKLEKEVGIHQSYAKMLEAIQTALEKISLPRVVKHNQTLTKKEYHVQLENLLDMVAATAGAASPIGGIIVTLLGKLKNINFFSSQCETTGHGDQSLGIVEVSLTGTNGIVLFEIARVNVFIKNKQGHFVAFGGEDVKVQVDAYYGRGTVALRDLFPDEKERMEVIVELKKAEQHVKTKSKAG